MVELNKYIFVLLLAIGAYFFNKYFLLVLAKTKFGLLDDNQFQKPQAFHEKSTFRSGGITIFFQSIILFIYLWFSEKIFFPEYASFCTLFFLLGLMDDIKIKISQSLRLFLMSISLILLVIFNEFYVERTGLTFLNNLIQNNQIFSIIFVCLCFLFVINGSNLVDGFNGLLGIHALIITLILVPINILNENSNFAYILFCVGIIIMIFLMFNFPKAQMFLGDSGAYLIGSFVSISVIKTSTLTPSISPFFFCILLVYLFFEAFFSFCRKRFIEKQHPLHPDNKHMHMLLYKFFVSKNKSKEESNYTVSVYINFIYFLLVLPAFFFMDNGIFCKYYFLFLILVYFYFYKMLYKKVK